MKIIRRLALVGLVALAFAAQSAQAGPSGCTIAPSLKPMKFEQITVSSTAVGFTAALAFPTGGPQADMAQFVVENNALRYRDDATDPSATVGFPITVGTPYMVCGITAIKQARFIRQSSDGLLNAAYYIQ